MDDEDTGGSWDDDFSDSDIDSIDDNFDDDFGSDPLSDFDQEKDLEKTINTDRDVSGSGNTLDNDSKLDNGGENASNAEGTGGRGSENINSRATGSRDSTNFKSNKNEVKTKPSTVKYDRAGVLGATSQESKGTNAFPKEINHGSADENKKSNENTIDKYVKNRNICESEYGKPEVTWDTFREDKIEKGVCRMLGADIPSMRDCLINEREKTDSANNDTFSKSFDRHLHCGSIEVQDFSDRVSDGLLDYFMNGPDYMPSEWWHRD